MTANIRGQIQSFSPSAVETSRRQTHPRGPGLEEGGKYPYSSPFMHHETRAGMWREMWGKKWFPPAKSGEKDERGAAASE